MNEQVNSGGPLRPRDLARLQRVFDEACRRREILPDTADARDMALALLALHNAGMADEELLIGALMRRRPQARRA